MIDVVDGHALLHLADYVKHKRIAVVIAIHTLTQVHFLINLILVIGQLGGDNGIKRSQINMIEQVVSLAGILEGCLDVLQSLHLK